MRYIFSPFKFLKFLQELPWSLYKNKKTKNEFKSFHFYLG
jgi:hypothetical protein